MSRKDKRIIEAETKVLEIADYILETIATPEFVQCVCKTGGDVVTYRVYNNGSIVEK